MPRDPDASADRRGSVDEREERTVGDYFASGHWHVRDGAADEFVERWREFLGWTRDNHPGLQEATLIRALNDPNRFVSIATWSSVDDRDRWKRSQAFTQRFSACRELCDEFEGGDYDRVVSIGGRQAAGQA